MKNQIVRNKLQGLKILFIVTLAMLSINLWGQNEGIVQIKKEMILFDYNKSDLKPSEISKLDQLAEFVKTIHVAKIMIAGHTDFKGEGSFNSELSKTRAENACNYLAQKGVGKENMSISFFGEDKPLKSNETDEGRQMNRRVEIELQYEEIPKIVDQKIEKADTTEAAAVEEFAFIGKQGTRVLVPGDFFSPLQIKDIDFKITEAYNSCSMITQGLNTMDNNGGCLQTGGMVFFNASYKSQEVNVDGKKKLEIWIPTGNPDKKMEVYIPEKGVWKELNTEVEVRKFEGKFYYVFNAPLAEGFNMDKLIGPCPQNGPIVKTRMNDNQWVFLDYNGTTITRGKKIRARTQQMPEFSSSIKPRLVAICSTEYYTYIVNKPLDQVKYSHLRKKYILRKKDYIEHEKFNDKESLANYLCR